MREARLLAALAATVFVMLLVPKATGESSPLSYALDFRIGGDIYVVGVSIETEVLPQGLGVKIKASLIYNTSNAPIFMSVELLDGNTTLGSLHLGFLRGDTSSEASTVIPAALLGSSLTVRARVYRGSETAVKEVKVPLAIGPLTPSLVITASVDSGQSLLAVSNEPVEVRVSVSNIGEVAAVQPRIRVYLDGDVVYTELLGASLPPGSTENVSIDVRAPESPGVHVLRIVAEAYGVGTRTVSEKRLFLVTVEPPRPRLLAVNGTEAFEGDRVCFEIHPGLQGLPRGVSAEIVMEYLGGTVPGWTPFYVTSYDPEMRSVTGCMRLGMTGEEASYRVRAVVALRALGSERRFPSNEVVLHVQPVARLLRVASVSAAAPSAVFAGSEVPVRIRVEPSLGVCLPADVEVFDPVTLTWRTVAEATVCGGSAVVRVPSSALPRGTSLLRAVIRLGGYKLASSTISIAVLPEPRLSVKAEPSPAAPGSPVKLEVAVKPGLDGCRVSARPEWTDTSLVAATLNGIARLSIIAPEAPGAYHVWVNVTCMDRSLVSQAAVHVANPVLGIEPSRATAGPGELVEYVLATTPPLDARAVVEVLTPKGEVLETEEVSIVNGSARVRIRSPQRPGDYVVSVRLKGFRELGVNATLSVQAREHRLTLSLSNTEVPTGASVTAAVAIEPPPRQPVAVTLLLSPEGNNSWATVASGLTDAEGRASLVFSAPGKPGRYRVKAVAASMQLESEPLQLLVKEGASKMPISQTIVAGTAGAVSLAVLAASIRAVRKR
ncbi:CARDB domain-containing protein [Pyrodictium abyssi]|uniref:CARDB domain-containing protein n=1 Tax=Pyrodictium abyssi TaxID=54256 RepID=A0ABM8IXT3_9CREN|nr:hypothetical protein PABY_04990 [Pyrodictium abyssi]